jgi:N-acetylmuramoyl-L-alanine amidase
MKLLTLFGLIIFSFVVEASNRITAINVLSSPNSTRVIFDLDNAPTYSYFHLTSPLRLVVDFSDSQLIYALEKLTHDSNLVEKIRLSTPKNADSTRIVFELTHKVKVNIFPNLASQTSAKVVANKLVVELSPLTPILPRVDSQSLLKNTYLDNNVPKKEVVVAVIAGHGGNDPGSIGALGNYEKNITFAIASKLVTSINNHDNMKGIMVRKADYYVNNAKKPLIARQNKADLLISIHADAYTSPEPNGASVIVQSFKKDNYIFSYLITNRQEPFKIGRSPDINRHITNDENIEIKLANMTKEFTEKNSYRFAAFVLDELKKFTRLHKREPEVLNLAVLKAPDIPSVLIETGFISNLKDEKNLIDPKYQQKLVNAIFMAISRYFYPEKKEVFSTLNYAKRYKVKSGDTLYAIAKRFKISVAVLKQANRLQSNTLLINQTLRIPSAQ